MTSFSSTTPRASSQQPRRDENYYNGLDDGFPEDYHHNNHHQQPHLAPHDISSSSLASHNEIYAGLESFSFGAPSGSSSSSLASGAAYLDTEDISPLTQRTPRPSVVVEPQQHYTSRPPPRGHLSAVTSDDDIYIVVPQPREEGRRRRERVLPDTASHHTFGPRTASGDSSCASSVHFSSEDEFNIPSADDQDHDDNHHSEGPSMADKGKRKASLPMDIPLPNSVLAGGSSAAAREREDSLTTLRRPSRSLGDELTQFAASRANKTAAAFASLAEPVPQSQPVSKADWTKLVDQQSAAIVVATTAAASSGSGHSSTMTATHSPAAASSSIPASQSTLPEADLGFDMTYILGGISTNGEEQSSSRRPSLTPSFAQPAPRRRSSATANPSASASGGGFNMRQWWSGGARRMSTATTTTIDDSFMGFVRKFDHSYDQRHAIWTFRRERADSRVPRADSGSIHSHHHHAGDYRSDASAPGSVGLPPNVQELWWCENVSRYKVDSSLTHGTFFSSTLMPPSALITPPLFLSPLSITYDS
jgi:hypothetical protein